MEILRLAEVGLEAAALRAAAELSVGGIVLYPTDTLYGLGADAFSDEAVHGVYEIKGRDLGKPMPAIVADVAMAERYGEVDVRVRALVESLPSGQITFVVPKKEHVTGGIARLTSSFGFRIPDDTFCRSMVRILGRPVTSTSANKSGQVPVHDVLDIVAQLGGESSGISIVVDAGILPAQYPSTVVDFTGDTVRIIREGMVPKEAIFRALSPQVLRV